MVTEPVSRALSCSLLHRACSSRKQQSEESESRDRPIKPYSAILALPGASSRCLHSIWSPWLALTQLLTPAWQAQASRGQRTETDRDSSGKSELLESTPSGTELVTTMPPDRSALVTASIRSRSMRSVFAWRENKKAMRPYVDR